MPLQAHFQDALRLELVLAEMLTNAEVLVHVESHHSFAIVVTAVVFFQQVLLQFLEEHQEIRLRTE
jgi:hypothetical protein